jgi:hypothetical protein
LFTVIFEGQVIVGGIVSNTVTVKVQVAVFPDESVAVKVFVVTPIGYVEPEGNPAVCVTNGDGYAIL